MERAIPISAFVGLVACLCGCSLFGASTPLSDAELLLQAAKQEMDSRNALSEAAEDLRDREEDVAKAERKLRDAKVAREKSRAALGAAQARVQRSQQRVSERATDAALFRLVQRRLLEDPRLKHAVIAVEVVEGTVRLHGSAPNIETREHALAVVREVPGVAEVEDWIVTGPRTPSSGVPLPAAPLSIR